MFFILFFLKFRFPICYYFEIEILNVLDKLRTFLKVNFLKQFDKQLSTLLINIFYM